MKTKTLVCMALLLVLAACAGIKPMTAKQQSAVWLGVYNAQYDDCMSIMTNQASTAAQKDIARQKKALLAKIWPLLKVYTSIIDDGGTPMAEDTQTLTELINQLTRLAGGE